MIMYTTFSPLAPPGKKLPPLGGTLSPPPLASPLAPPQGNRSLGMASKEGKGAFTTPLLPLSSHGNKDSPRSMSPGNLEPLRATPSNLESNKPLGNLEPLRPQSASKSSLGLCKYCQ